MGKMEQESKRRAKRNQIQKIILETVKTAGIISAALVAPNVLGAMVKVGLVPHPRQREIVNRAVDRLYARAFLKHGKGGLQLTDSGHKRLRGLQLKFLSGGKPIRWDGKWRVLIFDIPEKRRELRGEIRRTLIANGFIRLQNSVWVYPYDCEDWAMLWKAELEVGRELLYLIVDSVEGDSVLKRRFSL